MYLFSEVLLVGKLSHHAIKLPLKTLDQLVNIVQYVLHYVIILHRVTKITQTSHLCYFFANTYIQGIFNQRYNQATIYNYIFMSISY